MAQATALHEQWSSRFAFLMAAIGSSVGLGNFWRFPYTAGENGGAVFIFAYLLCIVLVAFPILAAEYAIGRRGQHSAIRSVRDVAKESGASGAWAALGWVGMVGAFLILTFYSMIGGWVIIYVVKAFSGAFVDADGANIAAQFGAIFNTQDAFGLPAEPLALFNVPAVIVAHTAFMVVTVFIVARGVNKGIAIASEILMPLFFVMLLGVLIFGAVRGDFMAAVRYLFEPDFSTLYVASKDDPAVMVLSFARIREIFSAALGQAFFSVGVGVGLMITYGSYLSRRVQLSSSSGIVAGSDTLVALIAGLVIFPLAFGFGQSPDAGPGLFFVTLPNAFAQMPGVLGIVVGGAFFLLALFAAITSSISLLEVSVAWLEEKIGSRVIAALILGGLCWSIGLGSVYSLYVFDFVDKLTEKVMLPLGGLLVAIFAGWIVSRAVLRDEFEGEGFFPIWRFLVRWVAPVGAVLIMAFSLYSLYTDPPALVTSLFPNEAGETP